MSKRVPETLSRYASERLDQILDVLGRASKDPSGIPAPRLLSLRDELESELLSLIHGLGLAHDGSETSGYWHEFRSAAPSHKKLAAGFRAMADAPNPLDPSVCTGDLEPELNALIRTRWAPRWKREGPTSEPSLRSLNWDTLSEAERADVRAMADHLAQYHQQFVRRGRPRKGDLDAAMIDLDDIFLSYTRSPIPRHEVPYADESLFIQLAVLALEPAAEHFEVSGSALSGRWERLVVEDRKVSKASEGCDTP